MPDHKRSGETRPPLANQREEAPPDREDVTVMFSPPKELLERTARERKAKPPLPAPRGEWESSEDEATLAAPLSEALANFKPKHQDLARTKPLPASPPVPVLKTTPEPARVPTSKPKPLADAVPALEPLLIPAAPAPAPSTRVSSPGVSAAQLEISEEDLDAILGPRRKARWLALGGVIALALLVIALVRFAP